MAVHKILIACEESQTVCKAFRKLGYEAYSCDILPASGLHLKWHIQADVLEVMQDHWDVIIAFPPCTHLTISGNHCREEKRADGREAAGIKFFMKFAYHPCPQMAIENPIGIMSSLWRKPDQIVQPWQFGHPETKATCLWLKNLPPLKPTKIVSGRRQRTLEFHKSPFRAQLRSKTYQGIADAMAEQWSKHLWKPK